MPTKRGIIILDNNTWAEVPATMLEDEEITWPPGMPAKPAGSPVKVLSLEDFYRRHEVVPDEFYVYTKPWHRRTAG